MANKYTGEDIKVLNELEGVRLRPSMYIGNVGVEGFHHLAYEIIDNSIDEALAGYCDHIIVTLNEDKSISIEDNGRGIPVDIHPTEKKPTLEVVLTKLHAGGKFDNNVYKVSGGLHGVGSSVVNALSEFLEVEVYRDNKIYYQKFKRGKPVTELKIIGETNKRGTKVTFKPDKTIFKDIDEFNYDILHSRLRELAFLNPNIKITLIDKQSDRKEEFHYKGGLVSFVQSLNANKELVHDEVISISGEINETIVDIAFQYNTGYTEKILSYVNSIRTKDGGTHETGFKQALTACINKFISDESIPKNLKEKIEGEDVREGLTAVISVKIKNPQFEGQTKTKLGNSEVRYTVYSIVNEKLLKYLELNPGVAKKIISKVVEAARAREAARKAREIARKSTQSEFSMAGKLADCQEKDPAKREIFIVEGDSAGGSAKQGRDRRFQAILPLKGKIMNVEKARIDKILSSDEIKQIFAALGTGYGSDGFDINQLKYHKVVIMSDADVDGSHIRTLILTFFYRQMYPLIDKGMLYIAQPPLYRVTVGKNEYYLKNDHELNIFLLDRIIKDIKITIENEVLEGDALKDILSNTLNLKDLLNNFVKRNIPSSLILFIIKNDYHHMFIDNPSIKDLFINELKNINYELIDIKHDNNIISEVTLKQTDIISSKIIISKDLINTSDFKQLLKHFKKIRFYLDKKIQLIKKDEKIEYTNLIDFAEKIKEDAKKGITIQRYKGLGEMNPEQLWKTTMNPETRTLLKVTLNDAEEAERMFTILMGDKTEPRREFIYNHALEVSELDI